VDHDQDRKEKMVSLGSAPGGGRGGGGNWR